MVWPAQPCAGREPSQCCFFCARQPSRVAYKNPPVCSHVGSGARQSNQPFDVGRPPNPRHLQAPSSSSWTSSTPEPRQLRHDGARARQWAAAPDHLSRNPPVGRHRRCGFSHLLVSTATHLPPPSPRWCCCLSTWHRPRLGVVEWHLLRRASPHSPQPVVSWGRHVSRLAARQPSNRWLLHHGERRGTLVDGRVRVNGLSPAPRANRLSPAPRVNGLSPAPRVDGLSPAPRVDGLSSAPRVNGRRGRSAPPPLHGGRAGAWWQRRRRRAAAAVEPGALTAIGVGGDAPPPHLPRWWLGERPLVVV